MEWGSRELTNHSDKTGEIHEDASELLYGNPINGISRMGIDM